MKISFAFSAIYPTLVYAAGLALLGCSPSKPKFDPFGEARHSVEDFKAFPLARYQGFPEPIRELMRAHDIDLSHCWDSSDAEGNSLRACNRSRRMLAKLETTGWCRGSVNHISVDDNWMRCSDIPDLTPDDPKADSVLFDEADFREAARVYRGPAECMELERDPGMDVEMPLSDIYGTRVFTRDDEKYFPLAYYRSYPRTVQRLMQQSDLESNRCRGGNGNFVETLRACNRGDPLGAQLAKAGWCWGSIEHTGYLDHWMRCSDLGRDESKSKGSSKPSFDEAYLRDVYEDWKEHRKVCREQLAAIRSGGAPLNPPAP